MTIQRSSNALGTWETVVPTNGTTARSLAGLTGDTYNLKSLGATMSGGAGDGTNWQSAYAALQDGDTINVPLGFYPSNFSLTSNTSKTVLWNAIGNLGNGSHNNSVPYLGDGDTLTQFTGGTLTWSKQPTSNLAVRPLLELNYTNNKQGNATSGLNYNTPLQIYCYSTATAHEGTTGVDVHLYSHGQQGYGAFDLGYSSFISRTGNNWIWAGVFLAADASGSAITLPDSVTAVEMDLYANGPDQTGSSYNTTLGTRSMLLLHGYPYTGYPPRYNSTPVVVGQLIAQTVGGVLYIFQCTTAGTTASSAPNFNGGGTVTDGTAVWTQTVTNAAQLSHCINVIADPNCSYGTILSNTAPVYNAGIDFSLMTFSSGYPNAAGMRLAPNMAIDFSALGTSASQNYRNLQYNSTATALQYTINGTTALSILDAGGAVAFGGATASTITSGTGAPSSTQPSSSLYLRTGGASGARLYVSAGGGTWNAVAGV